VVGITQVVLSGTATPGATVTSNETAPDGTPGTFSGVADSSGHYSMGPFIVQQLGQYTEVLHDSKSGASTTVYYSGTGDFSASVDNTTKTVTAGQAANYVVTFTSIGGFAGTIRPAALNWSPQVPGATGSWSQQAVTLGSNSQVQATFTLQTAANTPSGTYNNIALEGVNGNYHRGTNLVSLTVNPGTSTFSINVTYADNVPNAPEMHSTR
jgi:hypothetical protein